MRLRSAPLPPLVVRSPDVADALEIDEFDRIAVRIVKIGVAAREATMPLILVQQYLDAASFHMGERGIKVRGSDKKRVMDQSVSTPIGRHMITAARQHKVILAAAHEDGGVILAPEDATDHLLVEPARPLEIGHRQSEVQDAGRPYRLWLRIADAGRLRERRAF